MRGRALNADVVIGGLMAAFGLAAVVASLGINPDPGGGWGARIFPLVGSGALLGLGVLDCVRGLRSGATFRAPDAGDPSAAARIAGLLVLSVGYVWLIGKVGYLLSTGVAAVLALMIFGVRRPAGLAVAAVVCPAVYHLIFFVLLGVFPPYGEWIDLLDITQGD